MTKAKTLEFLQGKLTLSVLLPQYTFCVADYEAGKDSVFKKIPFHSETLMVRSSALDEDQKTSSMAGKYLSMPCFGEQDFHYAVQQVIASYQNQNSLNEILVQPMLQDVTVSGVVFTAHPATKGNYYCVNFDDTSSSTSSVTAGNTNHLKSFFCFKNKIQNPMHLLLEAIQEIESIFPDVPLDIEFAIAHDTIYILQVRPLILNGSMIAISQQEQSLKSAVQKFKTYQPAMFSKMTDWNIVEVLGNHPSTLALSIFQYITGDSNWARTREALGYQYSDQELIVDFTGTPFVYVPSVFQSMIPKGISDSLSKKLQTYYLQKLMKHPELHDKAEFEILFTCYSFDTEDRLKQLAPFFSEKEILELRTALIRLTNHILCSEELHHKYIQMMTQAHKSKTTVMDFLNHCKDYGIPAFVALARFGFIASQILNSLKNKHIISEEEYRMVFQNIHTISQKIEKDFSLMKKEDFLKVYGFLRPGTYEIESKRYDEAPDLYFDWSRKTEWKETNTFDHFPYQKVDEFLKGSPLNITSHELISFIKKFIEYRELSKFYFTKDVSDALKKISEMYPQEEKLSHLNILTNQFEEEPVHNQYASILKTEEDFWYYMESLQMPNYVTEENVTGEITASATDISEKILLLEYADAGYDWIFSKNIKGFITKYGGCNSHMAIRANERNIPCVLGIGETLFETLKKAKVVNIDAKNKKITIIL